MSALRYISDVATLRLDSDKCVGCGKCVEVCPHAVFAVEERKARIADRDACMECGACQQNCSVDAISVDAGVGCAAAIIMTGLGSSNGCDCSVGSGCA
jgi:NAD-dependent dihydropyrimidine dehydrogenase PreA subunit